MIKIYICEDDTKQLNELVKYVNRYLLIQNTDMKLVAATTDPSELIVSIDDEYQKVYLLDIDLNNSINGIELASKIRDKDSDSKIIFITTHIELAMTTFQYHLEVLDFILKDQPDVMQARINQVLELAEKRTLQAKRTKREYIRIKNGVQMKALRIKDILFIESCNVPHKLVVHLLNSQIEYYGTIKEAENFAPCFFRCHKSFVVNRDHIQSINKRSRRLLLSDGETVICSVSAARTLSKMEYNNCERKD